MLRKVGKINNLNDMIKFIPKEIICENLVTIETIHKDENGNVHIFKEDGILLGDRFVKYDKSNEKGILPATGEK